VLGFKVRDDVEFEGMRWVSVSPPSQPDVQIVLEPAGADQGATPADRQAIEDIMAKGLLVRLVFVTDDCDATRRLGQVVVAIPAGLQRRIGDEFKKCLLALGRSLIQLSDRVDRPAPHSVPADRQVGVGPLWADARFRARRWCRPIDQLRVRPAECGRGATWPADPPDRSLRDASSGIEAVICTARMHASVMGDLTVRSANVALTPR
jgi:hypothetical protein